MTKARNSKGYIPGTLFLATALGGLVAYFLDPRLGHRRRVLLKDRGVHLGHEIEKASRNMSRDSYLRSKGLIHEGIKLLQGEETRSQRRARQQKRWSDSDHSPDRISDPMERPTHALKNLNPVRSQRRSQNQFHKTQYRR